MSIVGKIGGIFIVLGVALWAGAAAIFIGAAIRQVAKGRRLSHIKADVRRLQRFAALKLRAIGVTMRAIEA